MSRIIEVTEVILRDAHQSLMATRLATDDMIPALEDLDNAGYWSLECWGGATFDSCIRFLNEDPWERLRTFKRYLKKTPTQMLFRAQNILGYRHYADDVVRRFVERSAANGMNVFRIFDAVNDPRNLECAIAAVKKLQSEKFKDDNGLGVHVQGCICYSISPVHTIEKFVELGRQLQDMGVDSICIKDMAALIKPQPAYDLVKALKKACGEKMPIHLHVHATTGVTLVSIMKAVEAGLDIVDTALSAMSLGTGHNPTEAFAEMLEGTPYTHRLDMKRVVSANEHFARIPSRYQEFYTDFTGVTTSIFQSQIPGGMLSNMESQLKAQGAGHRLDEVLAEVPKVKEAAGHPPLVTPTSQIVGTQAVFNVLMGEWKTLDRRVHRPRPRLLREDHHCLRSRGREGRAEAVGQASHHLPPGGPHRERVGQAEARGEQARGLQRQRRGRADLRALPEGGAPGVQGPRQRAEEPGQGARGEAGSGRGSGGCCCEPSRDSCTSTCYGASGGRPSRLHRHGQRPGVPRQRDAREDRSAHGVRRCPCGGSGSRCGSGTCAGRGPSSGAPVAPAAAPASAAPSTGLPHQGRTRGNRSALLRQPGRTRGAGSDGAGSRSDEDGERDRDSTCRHPPLVCRQGGRRGQGRNDPRLHLMRRLIASLILALGGAVAAQAAAPLPVVDTQAALRGHGVYLPEKSEIAVRLVHRWNAQAALLGATSGRAAPSRFRLSGLCSHRASRAKRFLPLSLRGAKPWPRSTAPQASRTLLPSRSPRDRHASSSSRRESTTKRACSPSSTIPCAPKDMATRPDPTRTLARN